MNRITRKPIRDQVHDRILNDLIRGRHAAHAKLKDTDLADALGVSRTPIREALVQLVQAGFLENPPGRGFVVRPLDRRQVGDAHPMLWTLEILAVRMTAPYGDGAIADLIQLSVGMAEAADSPRSAVEADARWHERLISGSGNAMLMETTRHLRSIIKRYEHAFMLEEDHTAGSLPDHAAIIDSLRQHDIETATGLLEQHWRRSLASINRAMDRLQETTSDRRI